MPALLVLLVLLLGTSAPAQSQEGPLRPDARFHRGQAAMRFGPLAPTLPSTTPLPLDAYWDDGFAHPGISGTVYALAYGPDGTLYAGGDFRRAGGVEVNHVAAWDGRRWRPLGSGSNGSVRALAMALDGTLYASGWFTESGGARAFSIASWDGAQWRPIGGAWAHFQVNALAVAPEGMLYAGGYFAEVEGDEATSVVAWDGSRWAPLGRPLQGSIHALALAADGTLYTATHDEGQEKTWVTAWDGTAWQPVGNSLEGRAGTLGTTTTGELFVGMSGPSWNSGQEALRWDGASWRPFEEGAGANISAMVTGPDGTLYAAGYFEGAECLSYCVAAWSGAGWDILGRGFGARIRVLAVGPDGALSAGGSFLSVGGEPVSRVVTWDGTSWQHHLSEGVAGAGVNGVLNDIALGPGGTIYVGGSFTEAGGEELNNVAAWDGLRWHSLDGGLNTYMEAVAVGPDGMVYAGGASSGGEGIRESGLAAWDGTSWHLLGGARGSVSDLALAPDGRLYVAGHLTAPGVEVRSFGVWDGASWTSLADPVATFVRKMVIAPEGTMYAIGSFARKVGETYAPAPDVAHWDGKAWSPLDDTMWEDALLLSLALGPNGSLYVGGFRWEGSGYGAFLAEWDGKDWSVMGSPFDAVIHALTVDDEGILYVAGGVKGGDDGAFGGVAVAAWDGAKWTWIGSGLDSDVTELAFGAEGSLYVAGWFESAGGKASSSFARWTGQQDPGVRLTPRTHLLSEAYPNPFADRLQFTLAVQRHQEVRVSLYDVQGRLVRMLFSGPMIAGEARTFTLEGSGLAGGVYFYHAAGEHFRASGSVIRVR